MQRTTSISSMGYQVPATSDQDFTPHDFEFSLKRRGSFLGGKVAVNGDLELTGISDSQLPANLTIHGNLTLKDCPNLTTLPTNLNVIGHLSLQDCRNLCNSDHVQAKSFKSVGCPFDVGQIKLNTPKPKELSIMDRLVEDVSKVFTPAHAATPAKSEKRSDSESSLEERGRDVRSYYIVTGEGYEKNHQYENAFKEYLVARGYMKSDGAQYNEINIRIHRVAMLCIEEGEKNEADKINAEANKSYKLAINILKALPKTPEIEFEKSITYGHIKRASSRPQAALKAYQNAGEKICIKEQQKIYNAAIEHLIELPSDSLEQEQELLSTSLKAFGTGVKQSADCCRKVAELYKSKGQYVQSQFLFEKALQTYRRIPDSESTRNVIQKHLNDIIPTEDPKKASSKKFPAMPGMQGMKKILSSSKSVHSDTSKQKVIKQIPEAAKDFWFEEIQKYWEHSDEPPVNQIVTPSETTTTTTTKQISENYEKSSSTPKRSSNDPECTEEQSRHNKYKSVFSSMSLRKDIFKKSKSKSESSNAEEHAPASTSVAVLKIDNSNAEAESASEASKRLQNQFDKTKDDAGDTSDLEHKSNLVNPKDKKAESFLSKGKKLFTGSKSKSEEFHAEEHASALTSKSALKIDEYDAESVSEASKRRQNQLDKAKTKDKERKAEVYTPSEFLAFLKRNELPSCAIFIKGDLKLADKDPVNDLPDGLIIEGSLDLSETRLQMLPERLNIAGDLKLSGCLNLNFLPRSLHVGGSIDLSKSGIKRLPERFQVSNNLNLSNSMIKVLPDYLQIGGKLKLSGCNIIELPKNLQVGRHLNLSNCRLQEFPPKRLQVGDYINLSGCDALFSRNGKSLHSEEDWNYTLTLQHFFNIKPYHCFKQVNKKFVLFHPSKELHTCVTSLLKTEPNIILKNTEEGWTLLHEAAYRGNIEAMKIVIEMSPNLISQFIDDKEDLTIEGSFEEFAIMNTYSSSIVLKYDYWTPLHAAAFGGQIEAGKWLVNNYAKMLNFTDNKGNTPRQIAEQSNQKGFATWIRSVGGTKQGNCVVM